MARTLKNLALALLNATLILIALCLFLAWKAADTLDGLTATFAQNLQILAPLADEVAAARQEIGGLRQDLTRLTEQAKAQGGAVSSAALQQVETRLATVNDRIAGVQTQIGSLAEAPERMVDRTVETAGAEFSRRVMEIRECSAAPASGS